MWTDINSEILAMQLTLCHVVGIFSHSKVIVDHIKLQLEINKLL